MKILNSPWILMSLALVMHLAGYLGALITHPWEMPVPRSPEPVEEEMTIETLLESRSEAHNWYFKTAELDKYVEELKEREAQLGEREITLENLQAHLSVEREELLKLKAEIERRHKALSDEIIVVRRNEITNLRTLANSYSNITPAAAVAIFEQMDDTLVIKIVSLMKADVVAQILEELAKNGETNPAALRRAARLSEELRLHYKEN
jgi:flagellar motility protein MotE (MotC chaperone)